MHTASVDGGRINIAPTVALTAGGIEVGIAAVAGERVMREMERPVALALRALHGEVTLRVATGHVFKRTGIGVIPVVAHRSLSLSESTLSGWVEKLKGLFCWCEHRPDPVAGLALGQPSDSKHSKHSRCEYHGQPDPCLHSFVPSCSCSYLIRLG
jgi:hypothetical protein